MLAKGMIAVVLLAFSLVSHAEVVNIDSKELLQLIAKGVPLIDIRTEGEWNATGVVAGSKLLTFFDERGQANTSMWLERAKPIAGPDTPVILICRSGNRSNAAAQFLSDRAGYKTVYNVSRGMNGWVGEGRKTVSADRSMAVCSLGGPC